MEDSRKSESYRQNKNPNLETCISELNQVKQKIIQEEDIRKSERCPSKGKIKQETCKCELNPALDLPIHLHSPSARVSIIHCNQTNQFPMTIGGRLDKFTQQWKEINSEQVILKGVQAKWVSNQSKIRLANL
ncbi:MAG: hypothetical protein EZS28_030152 [Streblomastix strix]|uniref:Uncharacterized protein n=1 Tax=Streblomastix strix TaxID=222440 RepID=A0A5J4UVY8_9EUKA|nr:MAG: hypothetical protein EZS28_030152 [Streblomastix strix]